MKHWGLAGLALVFLIVYNGTQPDLMRFRSMYISEEQNPSNSRQLQLERYGPSLEWLSRVMRASGRVKPGEEDQYSPQLDARVLSSLMVAGLASGFKSQVANLLWMKSDEYWHKGMLTRQNPLMEMVVTLDPQFIEAWSTAGWHWAYNIYADIPMNPANKNIKPISLQNQTIREEQERAIATGLDYLSRGSNMNPETYRLWFEWGWTRAEKAGIYDEVTVNLFRTARSKSDAREIEKTSVVDGEEVTSKERGDLDVVGHTIAHIYENVPLIDRALDAWGRDLLQATPAELQTLQTVGEYWRRYGSDYTLIAQLYSSGDVIIKNRIRQMVPDIERLVAAQQMRERMQARASTPTGAFVTIAARYLLAWRLREQERYQDAVNNLIGVMNADPRVHLTDLQTMAQIYELRGDAPAAIQTQLENLRTIEKTSSQDIGLHFLASLYEDLAADTDDPKQQQAYHRLAYETWYRSRERSQLDFYALRNTRLYEDKYDFTAPQNIIAEIKASRKTGEVKAAPALPPNVEQYYQPHMSGDGHAH